MSGNTANPRVWINADAYTAPLGSPAPTDVTTDWDASFNVLGLLSEDGMTETSSDTTDDKYAHGGILIRTTRSKHKATMKIIALEDNPVVYSLMRPGSTASTSGEITTRNVKVPGRNNVAFGLELHDGDVISRRVIPSGEIFDIADIKISDSDLVQYEMTINIYPDADGLLYIDITNDPQAVV